MHGKLYSNSSKVPSLHAAVLCIAILRAAVFRSKILRSDRNALLIATDGSMSYGTVCRGDLRFSRNDMH